MKKTLLFLLVSFSTLTAIAQQAVTFKVSYKPNTVYNQTMSQTAKNEVSYKASEEILEMLTAQGITNPTITENKTTTSYITTTGKLNNNQIPVSVKVSLNDGTDKKMIPDNTTIYGMIKQDGLPVFDSIHSPDMDANIKEIFLKSIQTTMSQIVVPERKVKVGETFTIDQPMSMPVGPAVMNINNTATYKLLKVEGRKAHFDVSNAYVINSEVSGQQIKGTGFGTGNLVYDLDHNFIVKQNMTMNMLMGFDTNGITLNIKFDSVMATDCTIAPVK